MTQNVPAISNSFPGGPVHASTVQQHQQLKVIEALKVIGIASIYWITCITSYLYFDITIQDVVRYIG